MKCCVFREDNQRKLGIWRDENLFVLEGPGFPGSLEDWIAAGPSAWPALKTLARGAARRVDPKAVQILAPLSRPGKIVAIGLNYLDHCREQNVAPPSTPMVFTKFVTALIGPGDPITWDPDLTAQVDYEAELGVVIGRRARRVSKAEALDYVFGYTAINDVTARDLQRSDRQWVRSKSLDSFCPLGPCVVSADTIPDPQKLAIRARLNGKTMQDSSTSEMVFGVADLVSILSQAFTLEPGDVIATGTPNGVGVYKDPPVFLKDGDLIEIEVEGIGVLANPVRLDGPG
jgi:2-keto-4-pentenoate hydratase/2-oxohepta-3-ene-1,7-dioic acid hydratase in catechol pathway